MYTDNLSYIEKEIYSYYIVSDILSGSSSYTTADI